MANTIRTLNCEIQKLRYAQATSTAQYNGWLAAKHLDLPVCTKLMAKGSTVLVMKCNAINVTFTTEITKCGPQLRYENLTLNTDGWELIPFVRCHSQNAFVNVNGIPHVHKNNVWEPMKNRSNQTSRQITSDFKYIDVGFSTIEQQANGRHLNGRPFNYCT